MNNVCLTGQVAVLFRRLVHVVSTVSAVQQYHFHKRNRSTPEHTSSQPTIECQGLPLGQTLLSPDRSSTIPRVLAEQWDRLKGRGFWDSWRSSLMAAREPRQGHNFGVGPLAFLPWFRPTRPHSTHSDPLSDQTFSHPTLTSEPQPSGPESDSPTPRWERKPNDDTIKRLMLSPTLFDPMRRPRYPIVLCHGLYGFDVRGPASFPPLQQHYWHNILNILRRKVGAEVIVTAVPSTGSIASRAEALHNFLQSKAIARGVNFIGHSMGGLDCRCLISHFNPTDYVPLSLTTVGTPHRGSPFMDWCQDNIGLGKMEPGSAAEREVANKLRAMENAAEAERAKEDGPKSSKSSMLSFSSLPSSFTTYLLSMLDSPAYANLTTKYLTEVFNPATPDNPRVKYFSIAGRCDGVSIWHPLWLPKLVLDGYELKLRKQSNSSSPRDPDSQWGNDCLVTIESAKWGEFLGVLEECDHWAMRGASVLDLNYDLSSVAASIPSLTMKLGAGNGMDGDWSLLDWGRFVKLWRTEESNQRISNRGLSTEVVERGGSSVEDAKERDRENALKTSTDNVSAMVDWIVDQVPLSSKEKGKTGAAEKEESRKRDIASKEGLERLYVALSKKLYDEGL
ncbi:alpha beta-hydrolase [Thelephora terrestris]|uniref:Alpha beta-hydrolase n=1 Tax=Thelephora terrestris TaxID=56493 RepID=A0A9P6L434_9AGAM|nr:alpha beta-hydrolase [Thelephora terrestris]